MVRNRYLPWFLASALVLAYIHCMVVHTAEAAMLDAARQAARQGEFASEFVLRSSAGELPEARRAGRVPAAAELPAPTTPLPWGTVPHCANESGCICHGMLRGSVVVVPALDLSIDVVPLLAAQAIVGHTARLSDFHQLSPSYAPPPVPPDQRRALTQRYLL